MSFDNRHNRIDYLEFSAASAESLRESRRFYEKVFGWQYKEWGSEYVDTQSSGVASGIAVKAEHRACPLPVIFASKLEQARERVLEAGARLTKDIFSFPGGRRFEFVDPAGNEAAVWSDK